jgi:hypothetical protein
MLSQNLECKANQTNNGDGIINNLWQDLVACSTLSNYYNQFDLNNITADDIVQHDHLNGFGLSFNPLANGYHQQFDPPYFEEQNFAVPHNEAHSLVDLTVDGRFLCTKEGCTSSFTRKADRDRHLDTQHGNVRHFHCHILGCNRGVGNWKGYSRIDKLQEHMRKKHASVEVQATM